MQIPWLKPESKFRQLPWIRLAIIGFVLLVSTQIYRFSERIPLKYWFFLAGLVIFSLLALRYMTSALTLVLLTSATTGIVIGTGRATPIPLGLIMVLFLVVVWVLKMMILERQLIIKKSPLNLPIIIFLIVVLFSWIAGYAIWDIRVPMPGNKVVVQAGQFAIYFLSFATMFLTAHQALHIKDLKLWTIIVVLIGFGEIFVELFFGITMGRDLGINGALFVFPVVMVGAQLLFNPNLKHWLRPVIILVLVAWLVWAFRTQIFKGGWLPAMFGLVILAPFKSWKLFLVGCVMIILVFMLNWDTLIDIFYRPEVESTSSLRPLVWWDVIRITLPRSPIFGLGLANYMYYWSDPTFVPISRIAAGWEIWNAWGYAIPSHNMFVDVFAQSGIIGLVTFLWAMGAILVVILRVYRSLAPGFLKAYVVGVFAAFTAMLIGSFLFADWLIPFVYNITITGFRQSLYAWILLGSVLGLYFKIQDGDEVGD
jgi:hypothetical protein